MPQDRSVASFSPAKMRFPTDRVRLGQMRQAEPQLFEYSQLVSINARQLELIAAHCCELTLAENAFANAAGGDAPHPTSDREQATSLLHGVYLRYGLSDGIHQTREMIRDLERAAIRQVVGKKRH